MRLFIRKKSSFAFISLHFLNHILIGSFSRHHFPPENENLTIVHRETLKLIQTEQNHSTLVCRMDPCGNPAHPPPACIRSLRPPRSSLGSGPMTVWR